jgi:dimeric dUTPase (all-alpha-NTP-PPase superfamily)
MNLEKLFQMQKELGKVGLFNYRGPDRFEKLILALLVELGECANEWRGFKFWSQNQEPRTKAVRVPTMMEEDKEYYNPMLEEYVDGFHFVLEIGIELTDEYYWDMDLIQEEISTVTSHERIESEEKSVTDLFNTCFYCTAADLNEHYVYLFAYFLILGERLGFTWEQIEQAYFAKNAVNHQRQEDGY